LKCGRIEQVAVHAVAQRAQQRIVGIVEKRYRESGGESSGAGKAPARGETVALVQERREWYRPRIAGFEAVLLVPC
jgi:hypothetical protein